MLKSIKQIAQETLKCDFCSKELNLSTDRWITQDDGSYIHIDCIEPACAEYKSRMNETYTENASRIEDFKLLSKLDPREPFGIDAWEETCELCGYITDSPNETHVCPERI